MINGKQHDTKHAPVERIPLLMRLSDLKIAAISDCRVRSGI